MNTPNPKPSDQSVLAQASPMPAQASLMSKSSVIPLENLLKNASEKLKMTGLMIGDIKRLAKPTKSGHERFQVEIKTQDDEVVWKYPGIRGQKDGKPFTMVFDENVMRLEERIDVLDLINKQLGPTGRPDE